MFGLKINTVVSASNYSSPFSNETETFLKHFVHDPTNPVKQINKSISLAGLEGVSFLIYKKRNQLDTKQT